MDTQLTDSTPEATARQNAIYRAMTGSQRVALMFEMSEEARALTLCGIRSRHPEWTEAAVVRHERVMRLGEVAVNALWGPTV